MSATQRWFMSLTAAMIEPAGISMMTGPSDKSSSTPAYAVSELGVNTICLGATKSDPVLLMFFEGALLIGPHLATRHFLRRRRGAFQHFLKSRQIDPLLPLLRSPDHVVFAYLPICRRFVK
jgi:hypothetical protein